MGPTAKEKWPDVLVIVNTGSQTQQQKTQLGVGSKHPYMFSRHWCNKKYIWHTLDLTHRRTSLQGWGRNERSAILDLFPENKEEPTVETEVMGSVRVESCFIYMLLISRKGKPSQAGKSVYSSRDFNILEGAESVKESLPKGRQEVIANRVQIPHRQKSKSMREGHNTQLLCLHRYHLSQDERAGRSPEASADPTQCSGSDGNI